MREIARTSFLQAFGTAAPAQDMDSYVSWAFSLDTVRAELAHPNSEFYLAYLDEHAVGYLKLNTGDAQTQPYGSDALQIQRLYLLKEAHGQGMGSKLMDLALSRARALSKNFVWLGVAPDNYPALALYSKYGFAHTTEHSFYFGSQVERDLVYSRTLSADASNT